ncbi:MAG: kelch repeat-containing protein [Planctomycetota bacterium]
MKRSYIILFIFLFSCSLLIAACKPPAKDKDPGEPPALQISGDLPEALVSYLYNESLSGTGGRYPRQWSIVAGSLPPGLSLSAESGTVSGIPNEVGEWTFTIRLSDSATPEPKYTEREFTIKVADILVQKGKESPPSSLIPTLSKDTTMIQLEVINGDTPVEIKTIVFTVDGSGNDAIDVENVRLYKDNNADGKLDDDDDMIGEPTIITRDDGIVTFTDIDIFLGPQRTICFILIYDFNKYGWPEESFRVSIKKDEDFIAIDVETEEPVTVAGIPLYGQPQMLRYPNWVHRHPEAVDSSGVQTVLLPRKDHDWAYDPQEDRYVFVMFGGVEERDNGTFEYNGNVEPTQWLRVGTILSPTDPLPWPRICHSMAFYPHPGSDPYIFMVSGEAYYIYIGYILQDTCMYLPFERRWQGQCGPEIPGNAMEQCNWPPPRMSPMPGRRKCHAMAWYPKGHFPADEPNPPYPPLDEVTPPDVVVLYGGWRAYTGYPPVYGDTWEWGPDPQGNVVWTQIMPSSPPGNRYYHTMVYHRERHSLIMFGGYTSDVNPAVHFNDTWEYKRPERIWSMINTENSPSKRRNHYTMYDPERNVVILFGGGLDTGEMFDDTWELAHTEKQPSIDWIKMRPENKPSRRDGHVIGWDIVRDMPRSVYNNLYKIPDHVGRVIRGVGVLFAGGSNNNDTWEYIR